MPQQSQRLSPKNVPQVATSWLSSTPGPGKSLWIYVDNNRVGIEYTHRIKRAFSGDFDRYEIPEDSIPSRIVSVQTKNEIYVLSQPNHISTVTTSMHGWSKGEVDRRVASVEEYSQAAMVLGRKPQESLDDTDFRFTGVNPETQEAEYIRKPSYLVVDAERPFWEQLLPLIGQASDVIETSRVPQKYSLEEMMKRKQQELAGQ